MEQITSRSNPLMVHLRKLGSSHGYRTKTGEYLGDGSKLLREALLWQTELTAVVYTRGTELPQLPQAVRVVEVPEGLMSYISPMETPQGVLFSARRPASVLPERLPGGRYLALEGVQDPGNVGTILRTADAFEADGLFLLGGCADPYSPKTLRASMGAVFRRPVWSCTLEELCALLRRAELPLVGTALRPDTVDVRQADLSRAVLLIGSEGRGLSQAALAACNQTVRIPMSERCESLNAAVAAAVVLWEGWR
ncbi:TrmH family RNA methyltransferase [uncultured Flavonifractor sp.]|uniref:TrmH family RNA methyltransferase n=1 Tax=uncultured Flavonifractor sp. TaxID=1193534 RepID=UPI00261EEE67|nr:RNA methyltransferase [uncultured Flavonifractor sp.]